MAAFETTPRVPPIEHVHRTAAMLRGGRFPVVPATIVGAWLIVAVAQATGNAAALHHDALIEGRSSPWFAVPIFLLAWEVMVAAMMLPASQSAIRRFQTSPQSLARPRVALAAFLGGYAVVWAVFGLLAFSADSVLHLVVDGTPWLGARPWLIEAGVLVLAGGYQFVPLKRRSMAACHHAGGPAPSPVPTRQGVFRLGVGHGLACLGSSWALMLVMFAAGFASLWSMAALTGLMVYQATGRHGHRAATAAGIVLLLAGLNVLASGS